jgi:5-formyltetrahydrofolate cyclo-ligase
MKEFRDSLGRDRAEVLSHEVGRRLFESSLLDLSATVALYASIRNEVATEWIFSQLRKKGRRIFLPRVTRDRIEFVEAEDWSDLVPGRWGVPEPRGGDAAPLESIEAVLVPGLAFDEAGARLGYGKGYFDGALGSYGGRKIGLAYDFQVLPAIPRTERDLVCDWIVTEKRIIRGASREDRTWNPSLS